MQADPAKVYGLGVDNKGRAKLRSKPVDVSELLRQELFARCPSVSLVSATLTTSGTFDFVRRERKQAVRFTTEPPPPPPEPVRRPAHVAKMLALAHHLATAIERSVVADRAAVARKLGLTGRGSPSSST